MSVAKARGDWPGRRRKRPQRRRANHAGLFVSILVRHPEVASVRFSPESRTLRFAFMVAQALDEASFADLARRVEESVAVFAGLTQRRIHTLRLEMIGYGSFTLLELHRDVESLCSEELGMLSGLLREYFGDRLVSEAEAAPVLEERAAHDEMIAHMLDDLREEAGPRALIGFREEGRVMVFNKPPQRASDTYRPKA